MATGSGIPRMKSLFSGGIYFHYFLSWRTLFVKTVGLTCAYSAGLTVGKEGPFVHIAACVATLLTRLSLFKRYADVSRLRHGLLATACATGVVAAFGCPFGGIIFAIEAVSTYFVVRSLPHMFISTTSRIIAIATQTAASIAERFSYRFASNTCDLVNAPDMRPHVTPIMIDCKTVMNDVSLYFISLVSSFKVPRGEYLFVFCVCVRVRSVRI